MAAINIAVRHVIENDKFFIFRVFFFQHFHAPPPVISFHASLRGRALQVENHCFKADNTILTKLDKLFEQHRCIPLNSIM
jgi:hypothetical protein